MYEAVTNAVQYLPTAIISLALGYLTYRSTRAGQQDTEKQQQRADRIAETQQALNAQLEIAKQWRDAYLEERNRRVDLQTELDTCRGLVRDDFEKAMRSVPSSNESGQPKNRQRKEHS